jgi:hypothetical protein
MNAYNQNQLKPGVLKCYCLVFLLVAGIVIGLYFLIKGQLDPQSKELSRLNYIISNWEQEYPVFSNLSVSLYDTSYSIIPLYQNTTQTWGQGIENFPIYNVSFYSNNAAIINNTNSLTTVRSVDYNQYNVTTNLTFTVFYQDRFINITASDIVIHSRSNSFLNSKICRNTGKGYWNGTVEICYFESNTIEICIVIDHSFNISKIYKNGCYNQGLEKQEAIAWNTDRVFDDFNYIIFVQVRSEEDPLVFASYNSLVYFSPSSKEYTVMGGSIFGICTVILIIPVIYFCQRKRKTNYLNMGNQIVKDTI